MGRQDNPHTEELYGFTKQQHPLLQPWRKDEAFMQCYSRICEYSLVDIPRCYELWHIIEQVMHLPGDVLEVGVWRGGTSALLAERIAGRKHFFAADTFCGVVKAGNQDNRYQGGEHADVTKEQVIGLLNRVAAGNWTLLEGIFPEDTLSLLGERSLCFCHIDVDVYLSAKDATLSIWNRMPVGGIIVYDDYGFEPCQGVRLLVDELSQDPDKLLVYNLNGHGILVKTA